MLARSYYHASIAEFLDADQDKILGELTHSHHFALDIAQKNAWLEQIAHLKEQLSDLRNGQIFFEFSIPRMCKRVDVVLFLSHLVTGLTRGENYSPNIPQFRALEPLHLRTQHNAMEYWSVSSSLLRFCLSSKTLASVG